MIRKIIFLFTGIVIAANVAAQNKYEEEIVCEMRDGQIILLATVKGVSHRFLLDVTRTSSAIHIEYAAKMGFQADAKTGVLEKTGIGQNLFLPRLTVQIIDDDRLKKLDVTGILGSTVFKEQVLTINKKEKVLTISTPFKPMYMSLRNRADMISGDKQAVTIAGKTVTESMDALFDMGVMTLDFPRAKTYFETYETLANIEKPRPIEKEPVKEGLITHLDRRTFLQDIFDFRQNDEWKYQSDMPCVIDFWATWCVPCRKLEPVIKELSEQYDGRVKFYKINIDDEKEIASGYFDIAAIPLLLFVPVEGEPVRFMPTGSKSEIEEKIEGLLLKK